MCIADPCLHKRTDLRSGNMSAFYFAVPCHGFSFTPCPSAYSVISPSCP
ncbi:hypothetical protein [Nemorincola caseinilytica]